MEGTPKPITRGFELRIEATSQLLRRANREYAAVADLVSDLHQERALELSKLPDQIDYGRLSHLEDREAELNEIAAKIETLLEEVPVVLEDLRTRRLAIERLMTGAVRDRSEEA